MQTTQTNPSREDLLKQIEALKAEMKGLPKQVSCKVSEKGAVSVYGLGRFPVTLYKSQWESLFNHIDDVKGFVSANAAKLATKN